MFVIALGRPDARGLSMPTIEMYPPSRIGRMPYSVSPRRNDQIALPKPSEYCVTLTLKSFANDRCPSSWSPIETSRPTMKTTTPRTKRSTDSTVTAAGYGTLPMTEPSAP